MPGVFVKFLIGLLAITIGILMCVFDPQYLIFKKIGNISKGSILFEAWQKPPVDLYLKVYLFNVTNREAFLRGDERLKVQDVGPYVYKEYVEHGNLTFNKNGTMTAVPIHTLTWIPDLSNGEEEDVLILPNVALLGLASVMSEALFPLKFAVNGYIRQTESRPLVEQTAREFMFGYESPLITLGNQLIPSWIPFDKLGVIDRMYDLKGDIVTFFSGVDNVKKAGLIDTYNRLDHLPQWKYPCDKVKYTSDGLKFPSLIEPGDILYFFRKPLCRSMPLERNGINYTINGLLGYEYRFKNGSMDSGEYNPENKCYCRNNKCLPDGLFDITSCYYGFPMALSFPHFFEAQPELREKVEGLNPSAEKHGSTIVINPESGLPLRIKVRLQINMVLDDLSSMAHTSEFSHMVLPLFWAEISLSDMPTSVTGLVSLYLNVAPVLQTVLIYFFMIGGIVCIFFSISAVVFNLTSKCNPVKNQVTENGVNHSTWSGEISEKKKPNRARTKKQGPDIKSNQSEEEKETRTYYFPHLMSTDQKTNAQSQKWLRHVMNLRRGN